MSKNNARPSRIAQEQRTVEQMQERRQQRTLPAMPRITGVCPRAPVPLPVWREEEHLQALPHSLLQACHERTDA